MPQDNLKWAFLVFLSLIIFPFIFWVGSLLFTWIKWLLNNEKKDKNPEIELIDFKHKHQNYCEFIIKITNNENIIVHLLDIDMNIIENINANIIPTDQYNLFKISFDISHIANNEYFIKIEYSDNQLLKRIIINNN